VHDHEHAHQTPASEVLVWALALTLGFAAFEALAGWWSGSLALLSDAGHMVADSASLGLAALAAWLVRKPPSACHSYSLGRTEIVAALVNAIFILVIEDLGQRNRVLRDVAHMLEERFDIQHVTMQPKTAVRPLARMPFAERS
jgi:Co/Zn/Cd efflux system component